MQTATANCGEKCFVIVETSPSTLLTNVGTYRLEGNSKKGWRNVRVRISNRHSRRIRLRLEDDNKTWRTNGKAQTEHRWRALPPSMQIMRLTRTTSNLTAANVTEMASCTMKTLESKQDLRLTILTEIRLFEEPSHPRPIWHRQRPEIWRHRQSKTLNKAAFNRHLDNGADSGIFIYTRQRDDKQRPIDLQISWRTIFTLLVYVPHSRGTRKENFD